MSAASVNLRILRQQTKDAPQEASFFCQVEELVQKQTSAGKPFWELKLRDAADSLTLRVWSETPNFERCSTLRRGQCLEVTGDFYVNGPYGLDAKRWTMRDLRAEEIESLFIGDAEWQARLQGDYQVIEKVVFELQDPRLRLLAEHFLADHGSRFCRATAARQNHHAYRGGLLVHTSQMMRSALALCSVYPQLNRDLLCTGVLFHDVGKLWETCPPEEGFEVPRDLRGELLGHITIGIELVNALWRKLDLEQWKDLQPPSDQVRLHLLHLIAAHHGELQYGSPIQPKTPEAAALHYIDNLDARLEMFRDAYAVAPEIAPGIYERSRPLNASPVRSLPTWQG